MDHENQLALHSSSLACRAARFGAVRAPNMSVWGCVEAAFRRLSRVGYARVAALGLAACAHSPQAVRVASPPGPVSQQPVHAEAPQAAEPVSVSVPRAPRVIIPAPPPSGSAGPASSSASAASAGTPAPTSVSPPLAAFAPQASPLLAAFDSSPRGQLPPPPDPLVLQAQQGGVGSQGWTPDFQPTYYGGYGAPGYGYGWGPAVGFGAYAPSYGYRYPGVGVGVGLGVGLGLGLGYGAGPYGYYGRAGYGRVGYGHYGYNHAGHGYYGRGRAGYGYTGRGQAWGSARGRRR